MTEVKMDYWCPMCKGIHKTKTCTMTADKFRKMKRKDVKEADVKAEVMKYLKLRGVFAWVNPRGVAKTKGYFIRYGGPPGASDIFGVLPGGRFLAIETKRLDGTFKPSETQISFLDSVTRSGGIGIVARSVEDVVDALKDEIGGW